MASRTLRCPHTSPLRSPSYINHPAPTLPPFRSRDAMAQMAARAAAPHAKILEGKVAVVTGASRGAGRGIALALGDAGATVYVTGRSVRGGPAVVDAPGTVDATAEDVERRGGRGVAVRCDHTVASEVEGLFARVEREQGRLDLLVNSVWGGNEIDFYSGDDGTAPFWRQPPGHWHGMMEAGVHAYLLASVAAAPIMVSAGRGLIINVTFWDQGKYTGYFYYDLAKAAMCRMAFGMAADLKEHGVSALALSPGFMKTERVVAAHDAADLADAETPEYLGRAVAHLAADAGVMAKSGRTLTVGELAREYGFTDVDGRQPPPFKVPEEFPGREAGQI
ncbi:unnamed protein product [Ostreobium quekettii]|uniref:Short-chain dehydrogenase/reductase SDR n=1 Tax=Ostreobium quekettii TaxID=121088 RepID=A0A8S1JAN8_9CHLO|nr:unnamed protein product [Ostreobium quekettii]